MAGRIITFPGIVRIFSNATRRTINPLRTVATSSVVQYNLPETKITTLANGIRVASEDTGLPTATVGLWIDVGSRYETAENNGVAHFLEHMIFKGTKRRSRYDLELEVENMGAQLNAYTSREQTVFYSRCLKKDLEKSVDILADIIQNSVLEEEDIEREKHVILREMEEIQTDMQEVVFDNLHAVAYHGTSLARTILGPSENVRNMTRQHLVEYVNKFYTGDRIVLAGAGGVNHNELVKYAEKYLGNIKPSTQTIVKEPCRFTGSELYHREDSMPYIYFAIAVDTCGWTDGKTVPLMLASTIMGSFDKSMASGPQSSNVFNKFMYERDVCMSLQSFNTCYTDTGLWGIYGVMGPEEPTDCVLQILERWKVLCKRVNEIELERAKKTLITNMLTQLDSSHTACEDIGRQMLCYGRRIPLPELINRINAVTYKDVQNVMMEYVFDRCPVVSSIGRNEGFPDYLIIRGWMYNTLT